MWFGTTTGSQTDRQVDTLTDRLCAVLAFASSLPQRVVVGGEGLLSEGVGVIEPLGVPPGAP